MARSEQMFRAHPVWRGSLPAVLDQAVEVRGWREGGRGLGRLGLLSMARNRVKPLSHWAPLVWG